MVCYNLIGCQWANTNKHPVISDKEAKGAFTPDANEVLRANDLHVKSMQRSDRQSCQMKRITQTNQELALAVT